MDSVSFVDEMTALIVGGWDNDFLKTTEIIPKRSICKGRPLPSLPIGIISLPSLVQTSEEEILLCGGVNNGRECLKLDNNKWQEHSRLKNTRHDDASAVSMPGGIYIFGGNYSRTTWEWLRSGTNQWQIGNSTIPGFGFSDGCAVKINDNEILLIGGQDTYKRVLKFNTNTKTFTNIGNVLNQYKAFPACTLFQEKVIIAGGKDLSGKFSNSTEIINLNNLTKAHTAGNLVKARYNHGIGVVHVDNKPTVVAVGGFNDDDFFIDSIEMWNPATETWTMSSMTLSKPKYSFAMLSLPTRQLCP